MLSLDTVMTKRIIPRSSCSVRLDIGLWSLVFCCLRTVKFKVGIDLPAPRSKLHVDHPIPISLESQWQKKASLTSTATQQRGCAAYARWKISQTRIKIMVRS